MLKKPIEMKALNEDFILQLLQHFVLNSTSGKVHMELGVYR